MKTPQGAAQVGWWRPTSFCCALLLAAGCNLDNPGIKPPEGKIAYPVALALSEDQNYLYVVNSNFDLRYNAGSVHSYSLDKLKDRIDEGSCFEKSTRGGERQDDAGTIQVPDNTMYPDASGEADAGLDAGAEDAGLDAGDEDAGLLDAGDSDAGDDDAGVDAGDDDLLDAGIDAGDGLDAGEDGGMDGGPTTGVITLPPSVDYGSQRGILCDGPNDYVNNQNCCIKESGDIFVGQVATDSYASALTLSPDQKTLYITVRSGNRLLYLDALADGKLGCGGEESDCTRGPDPKTARSLVDDEALPATPTSVVAGKLSDLGITGKDADATFVATTHEQGQLSLFIDRHDGRGPILEDVMLGAPLRTTSVSLSGPDPENPDAPQLLYVTSSVSAAIARFSVVTRGEGAGFRLLATTSDIALRDLTSPTDLRAVAVRPDAPKDLYVLIRGTLQSLAFLRIDETTPNWARTVDGLGLGAGPSKLQLGRVDGQDWLFASSYNAGSIFAVNPETRRTEAVITGLSGPFDMIVDEARKLMYVADFRASVVRVVDLSGLTNRALPPPRIVATLGELTFPERIR